MLDNPIIDIALGLVLFYVVLSLVASTVQEWIASMVGLRSRNLLKGIQNLIGDDYAEKVYEHPLVKNLTKKDHRLRKWLAQKEYPLVKYLIKEKNIPSYIAHLEVIAKDNGDKSYVDCKADEVRGIIGKIREDHPFRGVLDALIDSGEDAAKTLQNRLGDWFDEGMTRVSGWYKRRTKIFIFVIAGLVTMATNASTIHIAEELWRNDALRASIAAQAEIAAANQDVNTLPEDKLKQLESFPIGWSVAENGAIKNLPQSKLGWFNLILGWLLTTAAISLGAPFWFDLLGKVANLRGTGGKTRTPGQREQKGSR